MTTKMKVICFVLFQVIGAAVMITVLIKTGIMKDAAKHGDGVRTARPLDLILQSFIWEVFALVYLIDALDEWLVDVFDR